MDKIPYLKSLGITMIELMPAYEFNEIKTEKATSMRGQFSIESPTLNYWGYTDGYTFAPKAAYAFSNEAGGEVNEFKYLVRDCLLYTSFHKTVTQLLEELKPENSCEGCGGCKMQCGKE